MPERFNAKQNYIETQAQSAYVPLAESSPELYQRLGLRCGLEIHQQLKTRQKLFCHCPAGRYQHKQDFDAEIVRHMRPTLSELGEYDGTALMEFKTRKEIIYRLKNESACTYDIDDTPPFFLNQEALQAALQIALLLHTRIVGELHIIRKQYLDGSIPTGFQRTAIVGIEGHIPLKSGRVQILQLSLEEDSCREVSDIGHVRVYTTDRLGMPLIEMVTAPQLVTPQQAADAAQYLRLLTRSTGKVNSGIGAARQDVNVSIQGGTRVEIKGVAHIRWIPALVHNEAFRQQALLRIQALLQERLGPRRADWQPQVRRISWEELAPRPAVLTAAVTKLPVLAINLPGFGGILSFFTQPQRVFADELRDRLKVIACLEKPNMFSSEDLTPQIQEPQWQQLRALLNSQPQDAQVVLWGPAADLDTAVETLTQRCQQAWEGVPAETRKALANGTTMFERVLPGPDRMYPDTDLPPQAITSAMLAQARQQLPPDLSEQLQQLRAWGIASSCHAYLIRQRLLPLLADIITQYHWPPAVVGNLLGQTLKALQRRFPQQGLSQEQLKALFAFVHRQKLALDIIKPLLVLMWQQPQLEPPAALAALPYQRRSTEEILARLADLRARFKPGQRRRAPAQVAAARQRWLMGQLRSWALGNMPLKTLRQQLESDHDTV